MCFCVFVLLCFFCTIAASWRNKVYIRQLSLCAWRMQACQVLNDTRMLCMSPSLRQSALNSSHLSSISPRAYPLCYGFILDGVMSVRNLSRPAAALTSMFLVYADPLFHRFDDGFKRFFFLPNEYLTINVSSSQYYVVRSNTVESYS